MIVQSLKLVDGIIHLADARLPRSSQNPCFMNWRGISQPCWFWPRPIWLMSGNEGWVARGALAVSLLDNTQRQYLLDSVHAYLASKLTLRYTRPWRVMVAGIPNVGKSTLINFLARRRSARVGQQARHNPGQTVDKSFRSWKCWIRRVSSGPRVRDREAASPMLISGCYQGRDPDRFRK